MSRHLSVYRIVRNHFLRNLRRRIFKSEGCLLKVYQNPEEAEYEFRVLREIRRASPKTFTVPRPIELVKAPKQSILVMERIEGQEIQSHINRYLLFRDKTALVTLTSLGRALREFHAMDIGGLRNGFLPTSELRIREDTRRLSRDVLGLSVQEVIAECIAGSRGLDERVFRLVNLHGESYFSHVMINDGKFVLVDFHEACRGPAFYDLATFDISLYSSLLLPARCAKSLDPLVVAFWKGYLKGQPHKETMRAGEIYVALRALQNLVLDQGSPKSKIVNSLKIRRIQNFVRGIVV